MHSVIERALRLPLRSITLNHAQSRSITLCMHRPPSALCQRDDATIDQMQTATLDDMATLGLVYTPRDHSSVYYATPLAQHLLSGAAAGAVAAPSAPGTPTASAGFIVLETNYRLYACP